jgi:hypothetical protein
MAMNAFDNTHSYKITETAVLFENIQHANRKDRWRVKFGR